MKRIILLACTVFTGIISFSQSVPAYIPTNGLIAWYPFSGNANNAYGTGKNGSVIGTVLTTDRFGNPNSAYHFNGMADHIVIDTTFFNVGWGNFTVSFWLNADSIDNPYNANNNMSMFNTIPHNGICLVYGWMTDYKYLYWANQNPAIGTWNILGGVQSHTTVVAHSWKHYAAVKKNDTSYEFYLDGVLDSSWHKPLLASTYYCKIVLGNTDSSVSNFGFWGKLDDYGIWNSALSGCDIKRLFRSTAHLFITAQPVNTTGAISSTVHFSISDTGAGNTYQWQENGGAGFANLISTAPYSGVTTPTLTITGVTSPMYGRQYRCVVTGSAGCADTSASATLLSTTFSNTTNAPSISVMPNPATGHISVTGAGKVNIKLYNTIGQLMKECKQADEISIDELPAGVYLLRLFDDYGVPMYISTIIKK